MRKLLQRVAGAVSTALALPLLAVAPIANAATSTMVVMPSNHQGWVFNGDPATATPYEFNEDKASTGEGSLYVMPIGGTAANKFIASKVMGVPVADFESVAYDFLIAGDGTAADAQQFYLNVYTNLQGSSVFYNCRFDYVPATGSTTDFTSAMFDSTDTPVNVADRAGDSFTCPTTLEGMPAGSTVKFVAINVGDTSASDEGLGGYLDNVVIATAADTTMYDFEDDPTVLGGKDECKNGGWMTSEAPMFKNQGDCVSSFASQDKAGGNPIVTFFRNLF